MQIRTDLAELRDEKAFTLARKVSNCFAREIERTRRGHKLDYPRGAFSWMTPAVRIDPPRFHHPTLGSNCRFQMFS